MSSYSVAEAKNKLSQLIDRALKGENVVITRHGHPMVELRAVKRPAQPLAEADLLALRSRAFGRLVPTDDSVTLVRQIRDED